MSNMPKYQYFRMSKYQTCKIIKHVKHVKTKIRITMSMCILGILHTMVTTIKTDTTLIMVFDRIMGTAHNGLHYVTTTTVHSVYSRNHIIHISHQVKINQPAKWYKFSKKFELEPHPRNWSKFSRPGGSNSVSPWYLLQQLFVVFCNINIV